MTFLKARIASILITSISQNNSISHTTSFQPSSTFNPNAGEAAHEAIQELLGATQVIDARAATLSSWIGPPESDVTRQGNGFYRDFQNATLYAALDSNKKTTQAFFVLGGNLALYKSIGVSSSIVGYPTSDEVPVGDNKVRFNSFQFGAIYWSPNSGSHEVNGDIYSRWRHRFHGLSNKQRDQGLQWRWPFQQLRVWNCALLVSSNGSASHIWHHKVKVDGVRS